MTDETILDRLERLYRERGKNMAETRYAVLAGEAIDALPALLAVAQQALLEHGGCSKLLAANCPMSRALAPLLEKPTP